jgi:hypothetical protein
MADIRCQMCGKPNPADAEVCQFCQARLKPVWASKSADSFFEAEPESTGEEVPDWLRSLRRPDEPAFDQPPEETPEAGLTSGAESEALAGGDEWLSGMGDQEKIEPSAVDGVFDLQSGDNFSELLSGLTQPESEALDWRAETSGFGDEAGISPEEISPEAAPADEGEQTDWLERVKARQKSDEEQPKGFSFEPEPSPPSEEIPDWLTRMTLSETEIPEDSQAFPDWMKDVGQSTPQYSAETSSNAADQTPSDWLSNVLGPSEESASAPPFEDEFSAFMSEGSGAAKTIEPEAEEPGAVDAGLDWITGMYREPSGEPSEPAPTPAGDQDAIPNQDGYPDWLTALGVSSEQITPPPARDAGAVIPPEPALPVEEPHSVGETPDWLASLGSARSSAFEGAEEEAAEPAAEFNSSNDFSSAGLEEATPDWLANLDTSGTPVSMGGPAPFLLDEPLEAEAPAEYLGSTPDWLAPSRADAAGTGEGEPAQGEPEQESGLAPAELPNWLEAMRPVETGSAELFKDVTDDRVESAGPLSGLRGALPVGALPMRHGKASISALKIQVPEAQQNRATVLQRLLEDESNAKPLPAPALAVAPVLLRLIVFGLFVFASFFAIWVGRKQVPLPSLDFIPQGAKDFYMQVDLLPAGAPVLLAVDYVPGFAGELDGAAMSVLNHLASKSSLVTFVSTTYEGTALAQRLLASMNRQEQNLQNPFTNFKNLGYIPGGAAGLAAFARSPDLVLPYDLDDNYLWSSSPFDSAKGLSNFSLVVVITHDADTARTWIEQVGPTLGDIPMQMVVSAQAEPLVLPYYAGLPKQVSGIVTGLAGGVAYETLQGRSGVASQSWDAYSITLTLAVLLILVGGVMGIGSSTLSQYKQSKAEGEA